MTEAEWLHGGNLHVMADYLLQHVRPSIRKYHFFGCACCRRVWHVMPDKACWDAVEAAEWFADELVSEDELRSLHDLACESQERLREIVFAANFARSVPKVEQQHAWAAYHAAYTAVFASISGNSQCSVWTAADHVIKAVSILEQNSDVAVDSERIALTILARDIFGNPFRPVTIAPAWQSANVVALAQAIYDERAFDRMPILGDALEDAGCDNAEILDHCRQPGEHVRGCWVVDLLLGKK